MLKYFISSTELLLAAALVTGLITSFAKLAYGKKGMIFTWCAAGIGTVGAAVMCYMKNTTSKIDTSLWNFRTFAVSLCGLILFFISYGIGSLTGKKSSSKKEGSSRTAAILEYIQLVLISIVCAAALFYSLPDLFGYPYTILLTEKTVLSTGFLFKLIGVIFGMILVFLSGLAVYKLSLRLGKKYSMLFTSLVLIVNGIRQITVCLSTMLTKRMIISGVTVSREFYKKLFNIAKFTKNNENVFTYAVLAVIAVMPVIMIVRSLRQNEPYRNPAEKRKIRFKWKVGRRWAVLSVCCIAMITANMTGIKALANRTVELSPIEECRIEDGNCVVTFEQVADGHLHRFAYTTESGVQIRFIIIKKPDSSSYGIGLDACDICGETGYYEKDGMVVCKLCDVVMNIRTIGFKGGCNPIVIPYNIENGSIKVPIDGLLEYEKEFK